MNNLATEVDGDPIAFAPGTTTLLPLKMTMNSNSFFFEFLYYTLNEAKTVSDFIANVLLKINKF